MYVQTNARHLSDQEQAECAGQMEGIATSQDIYIHYHNNVKQWCKGRKRTCKKVAKFLKEHFEWVEQNIEELGNRSEIWHHVSVVSFHEIVFLKYHHYIIYEVLKILGIMRLPK